MGGVADDSGRATCSLLAKSLVDARAEAGRADARLEVARDAIRIAMWEAEAAARAGTAAIPATEVALILRRLWDVATLGSAVGKSGGR